MATKKVKTKRAKKRAESDPRGRTAEIIDAAAQVFARRGFHGASTQDIAEVVGVRQASLHYYFPSKEVALEMVCARGIEGYVEAAMRVAEGQGTASDKLRGLAASHLNPLRDRLDYVKVFLNERKHLPTENRHRIGPHSRAIERVFEDVLRAGIKAGEFRSDLDPRLGTLAILGMLNAVVTWHEKEPKTPLERVENTFAALVLDGVRRRGSRR